MPMMMPMLGFGERPAAELVVGPLSYRDELRNNI